VWNPFPTLSAQSRTAPPTTASKATSLPRIVHSCAIQDAEDTPTTAGILADQIRNQPWRRAKRRVTQVQHRQPAADQTASSSARQMSHALLHVETPNLGNSLGSRSEQRSSELHSQPAKENPNGRAKARSQRGGNTHARPSHPSSFRYLELWADQAQSQASRAECQPDKPPTASEAREKTTRVRQRTRRTEARKAEPTKEPSRI